MSSQEWNDRDSNGQDGHKTYPSNVPYFSDDYDDSVEEESSDEGPEYPREGPQEYDENFEDPLEETEDTSGLPRDPSQVMELNFSMPSSQELRDFGEGILQGILEVEMNVNSEPSSNPSIEQNFTRNHHYNPTIPNFSRPTYYTTNGMDSTRNQLSLPIHGTGKFPNLTTHVPTVGIVHSLQQPQSVVGLPVTDECLVNHDMTDSASLEAMSQSSLRGLNFLDYFYIRRRDRVNMPVYPHLCPSIINEVEKLRNIFLFDGVQHKMFLKVKEPGQLTITIMTDIVERVSKVQKRIDKQEAKPSVTFAVKRDKTPRTRAELKPITIDFTAKSLECSVEFGFSGTNVKDRLNFVFDWYPTKTQPTSHNSRQVKHSIRFIIKKPVNRKQKRKREVEKTTSGSRIDFPNGMSKEELQRCLILCRETCGGDVRINLHIGNISTVTAEKDRVQKGEVEDKGQCSEEFPLEGDEEGDNED